MGRQAAVKSLENVSSHTPAHWPNRPHIASFGRGTGLRFIPGARPGDHGSLSASTARITDAGSTLHDLGHLNGTPVNASRPDIRASVIEYRETAIGKTYIARHRRGLNGPTQRVEGKRRRCLRERTRSYFPGFSIPD